MRILIVDDEERVAQGVANLAKRLDSPFQEVQVAYSGEEALAVMAETLVDLLLTDISMPGLSGLELIEEARKKKLCEDFCLLSGYSEFEYARSAIRLGVEDYLLKPVDENELGELLERVGEKIRERADARLHSLEPLLAEALWSRRSEEQAPQRGSLPHDTFPDISRRNAASDGISKSDAPDGKIPWPGRTPRILLVTEALFRQSRSLSSKDFIPYKETGLVEQVLQLRQLPAFALFARPGRKQALLQRLSEDFPEFVSGTASGHMALWSSLAPLYEKAVRAALTAHCFLDRPWLDESELQSNLETAKNRESRQVLYQICEKTLLADQRSGSRWPTANPYIQQILDRVDRHCGEDLTLEYLSGIVGLNPDYTGRLFRSEMGISFSEYLNRCRISKILELMLYDPSQTFEQLSPGLGFSDVRNFYRVFKRVMGMTPGKYREFLLHRDSKR